MNYSHTIKYILGRLRAAQDLANQSEDRSVDLSRSRAPEELSQHPIFELPSEVQLVRLLTITLPKISRPDKLALYAYAFSH